MQSPAKPLFPTGPPSPRQLLRFPGTPVSIECPACCSNGLILRGCPPVARIVLFYLLARIGLFHSNVRLLPEQTCFPDKPALRGRSPVARMSCFTRLPACCPNTCFTQLPACFPDRLVLHNSPPVLRTAAPLSASLSTLWITPAFPGDVQSPAKPLFPTGPPSPHQAKGESHNPNKKQPPQRMNVSVHPLRGFSIAVCCLSGDLLNLSDFHSRPANRPPAPLLRKALPERAVAPPNPREAHLSGAHPWAFRGREGCTFSRSILHT